MKDKSRDDDIDPSGLIDDMAEEPGCEDDSEDEFETDEIQDKNISFWILTQDMNSHIYSRESMLPFQSYLCQKETYAKLKS